MKDYASTEWRQRKGRRGSMVQERTEQGAGRGIIEKEN